MCTNLHGEGARLVRVVLRQQLLHLCGYKGK